MSVSAAITVLLRPVAWRQTHETQCNPNLSMPRQNHLRLAVFGL
jgi:hypothetical protein